MDQKFVQEMKGKLMAEKAKIEDSLTPMASKEEGAPGGYQTIFEELGSQPEDNATEVDIYTTGRSVEGTLETKLAEINAALKKIDQGEYGVCEKCGALISIDRLEALPTARLCVGCM